MVSKLLNKVISLATAFAIVLSLSCCGDGDEVLIDEITEETTSEETITNETTKEVTINETTEEQTTLETTIEEVTETTTEAITISIPDETAEAILASLTDEEKEVWLSMPDIVTMRVLSRYDEEEEEICTEFLYNEIVYIDKMGQVKKFITYDDYTPPDDDIIVAWLSDQISQNENAEIINVANIHTLIEFYNTFMLVDRNTKISARYSIGLAIEIERHYWFDIYGIRDNGENEFETLLISDGDAECLSVRKNYTDDWNFIDTYGDNTLELYLKLDPFVIPGVGYSGHLAGEEV